MKDSLNKVLLDSRDCNCLALRQAARRVTQFYDHALASTGLRSTQYSILSRLNRFGPSTINVLASQLVTDRTTLARNLRPLQRDGLITIQRGTTDRRSKALVLSRAGRARLEAAVERWAEAQGQFEKALGEGRSKRLRGLLGDVVGLPLGEAGNQDLHEDA